LNLVERFFSKLTERRLRRLAVNSVDELIRAITAYIEHRDEHPTPFVWTAMVQKILKKVNETNMTLATLRYRSNRRSRPKLVPPCSKTVVARTPTEPTFSTKSRSWRIAARLRMS